MQVIKADVLGYCFGVRRAVEAAEEALLKNDGKSLYSLGPLIHNPCVLDYLQKKGLKILGENEIDSLLPDCRVIIRAHGCSPQVIEKLKSKGVEIVDATCPRVHSSQKLALKSACEKIPFIIAGDKNHGEVSAILACAGKNSLVLENVADAMAVKPLEEALFISQTTFSMEEFEKMKEILLEKIPKLKVVSSICPATKERQDALKKLSGKADGILVIGGRQSANTRRLFESALSFCKDVALIENESEIPEKFFAFEKVALTAGASTPDRVIKNVEEALLRGEKRELC